MTNDQRLDALPKHPVEGRSSPVSLVVNGLVRQALELAASALADLPQTQVTDDFVCEEGWWVPDQAWSGVLVGDLLDHAGVAEGGRWVEFAAEDFRFSIPIEEARRGIVALSLNGEPMPHEHGGPARLFLPGGACFTSIKWLDRIEVRSEEGSNRAAEVARGRLGTATSEV